MEDQNYILFETYLSNEMTKEEVTTFEARLKNEPDFNQAFNTYKELSSFLEHKIENEEAIASFQSNVKNISDGYFKEQNGSKKVIRMKPWQFAIAASVALLIGFFMFNQFSNPTFGDYNNYETISLTVRGEQDELLKIGENAFNTKDFAKAEDVFTQLLAKDEFNKELQLYKGIALIELNKFDEADNLFGKLSEQSSVYKNKAIWYLGLSKLKQKDHDACLQILRTLPEDADDYEEAKKLINKLD
jgi:tetratricopeptide (TPR) repeat protein